MKRYDVTDFGQSMGEFDDGEWVKYDDMEDLVEAVAAVVEESDNVFAEDDWLSAVGSAIDRLRFTAGLKAPPADPCTGCDNLPLQGLDGVTVCQTCIRDNDHPPADDDGGEADRAHANLGEGR